MESILKRDGYQNATYARAMEKWKFVRSSDFHTNDLFKLADPGDGKFDYPVDKTPNRTNTKRMRGVEAKLDRF
jgi:hypothetical protein